MGHGMIQYDMTRQQTWENLSSALSKPVRTSVCRNAFDRESIQFMLIDHKLVNVLKCVK